jgi:hypothetical protein
MTHAHTRRAPPDRGAVGRGVANGVRSRSISRILSLSGYLSGAHITVRLGAGHPDDARRAAAPPTSRRTSLLPLAPRGVFLAGLSPDRRCALTAPFHPYPPSPYGLRRAVSFLWHCPSGHPASPLTSTLPSGVRTFLPAHCARQPPGRLLAHSIADSGVGGDPARMLGPRRSGRPEYYAAGRDDRATMGTPEFSRAFLHDPAASGVYRAKRLCYYSLATFFTNGSRA